MNIAKHVKKSLLIITLVLSWLSLLWINFFGELSMAMHLIAIPFLLLMTTGFAAWHIEQATEQGNTAELTA